MHAFFLKSSVLLLTVGFLSGTWFWPQAEGTPIATHTIVVLEGGYRYEFPRATGKSVGEFLEASGLELQTGDRVFPETETPLTSGMTLFISRSRGFSLEADGERSERQTQALTVEEALRETGVRLDEDDLISPARESLLAEGTTVEVTRVEVSEETVEKPIAYKTETEEDANLSWRKKEVAQEGEPGTERVVYRVSRHNGKEVNRKLLGKEVIKEPVTEVVTQGTRVETGKSHSGAASWYAHTGTLAAANPWLPFGSYVKVTNTENGKSVIVKINDRGPFGPGRIIDLDKVAFQEIASLGTGVVNVKMEEITN